MVIEGAFQLATDATLGFAIARVELLEGSPQRRTCDGETTQVKYSPKAARAIG
jgi:hypothetical protein